MRLTIATILVGVLSVSAQQSSGSSVASNPLATATAAASIGPSSTAGAVSSAAMTSTAAASSSTGPPFAGGTSGTTQDPNRTSNSVSVATRASSSATIVPGGNPGNGPGSQAPGEGGTGGIAGPTSTSVAGARNVAVGTGWEGALVAGVVGIMGAL